VVTLAIGGVGPLLGGFVEIGLQDARYLFPALFRVHPVMSSLGVPPPARLTLSFFLHVSIG